MSEHFVVRKVTAVLCDQCHNEAPTVDGTGAEAEVAAEEAAVRAGWFISRRGGGRCLCHQCVDLLLDTLEHYRQPARVNAVEGDDGAE